MKIVTLLPKSIVAVALSLLTLLAFTTLPADAATTGGLKITIVVQGGTARPSDFTLQIKNGNSTISGSGNNMTFSGLPAGTYTITNTSGPSGYRVEWSGDCTAQGTVTIVPPLIKLCTATFIFGPVGSIRVNTVIVGGTAVQSDFAVHVKKGDLPDTGSPSGTGSVVTFGNLTPGGYTVIQSPAPLGYTVTWSGACNALGNVTVVANTTATCTVTNTFGTGTGGGDAGRVRPPNPPRPPSR